MPPENHMLGMPSNEGSHVTGDAESLSTCVKSLKWCFCSSKFLSGQHSDKGTKSFQDVTKMVQNPLGRSWVAAPRKIPWHPVVFLRLLYSFSEALRSPRKLCILYHQSAASLGKHTQLYGVGPPFPPHKTSE